MGMLDSLASALAGGKKKLTPEEIQAARDRMDQRTTRVKLGSEPAIDKQKPLGGDMNDDEIKKRMKEKR